MKPSHSEKGIIKSPKHLRPDSLTVNVGDLLHKQGSKDIVVIPDLFIDERVSNVKGTVELTGISDNELYAIVKNVAFTLAVPCDYCGKDKSFSKTLSDETYSFMLENLITPELKEEEVIFPISAERSIDLYSVIRDGIWLADDVQHMCEECKIRLSTMKDEEIAEDEDEHISGNIVFK